MFCIFADVLVLVVAVVLAVVVATVAAIAVAVVHEPCVFSCFAGNVS